MKALRFISGHLAVHDIDMPQTPQEALVRVSRSGICNTDLEIVRGYAGFEGTIGHEFVGVVEHCHDRPELAGQRVVGEINAGCGVCPRCRSGDPRHCPKRTVLGIVGRDGAHAEYLTLPSQNLLVVPDGVSDEEAVFTEPLAAAYGIGEQVVIKSDTRVAVIGDGKLGLLCSMCLSLLADEVMLVGKHEKKLGLAAGSGVQTVLAGDIGPEQFAAFDVVVEASGSESGFATALDLVRPRGKIVLKSTFQGEPRWAAWRVVVNEISIIGSRCGRFAPALDLLERKQVPVERLIDSEMPLADGVKAMQHAAEAGVLKVLLTMD